MANATLAADNVVGRTLKDFDGNKIGKIKDVFTEDGTGLPMYATVHTGLIGGKDALVPLAEARESGDDLMVPFSKDKVKDSPHVDTGADAISPDDEDKILGYYGGLAGYSDGDGESRPEGHDTSGPNTDDAMTRSEERLRVGTESHEAGRARLRKHVVTENVTQTVPVSHEEVRLEREPITDANRDAAVDGPAMSDEEHEVVLNEERPVVAKETVPVERVRLGTETVTDQEQVNADVQHEEIDTDGTGGTDRR